MDGLLQQRRILLVDDQPTVLDAVTFRLHTRGYTVLTATTVVEALAHIANTIFHLAIVDVCLADQHFRTDTQGFTVIAALPPYIPCIVYTAYEQASSARLVELGAKAIVDKRASDGAITLMAAVEQCFTKEPPLNLHLQIAGNVDLAQLAQQIEPASDGPPPAPEDIEVILQRLFLDAQRVELTPLLAAQNAAAQAQSGAVLLRAQEMREGGKTAPVVVKLNQSVEIEQEAARYELIKPYVGGQRLARLEQTAYSRQTGGLIYSLVGTANWQALHTLEEILHLQDDTSTIIQMLMPFLQTTFAEIHQAVQYSTFSLSEHYTTALGLTPEKLRKAMQQLYPPALSDVDLDLTALWVADEFSPPRLLLNPVRWILLEDGFQHDAPREHPVCLTHGDLHTRNILVDDEGQCWLVDFGRVASAGHALRDFAELETDIKFRVLPPRQWAAFYELETALTWPTTWAELPPYLTQQRDFEHWRTVIDAMRQLAAEQLNLTGDLHGYYVALFWHALNLLRLRRVAPEQKYYALLSAALLAERLANWPNRIERPTLVPNPLRTVPKDAYRWWSPWRWFKGQTSALNGIV